jgi:shikimate dehydrogenase
MRQFGLIGFPLGHSFSKGYFNEKFEKEHIPARYNNYPIEHIEELPALLAADPDLEGLSVTIPYKEQVIPYLHSLSPVVEETGACNCIRIRNGRLEGFNTDVIGFERSLSGKLRPHHTDAFVLGTGGASKAVQYVLGKLGIRFTVISRKADTAKGILNYESLKPAELEATKLWINTTPVGMHPKENEMPAMDYSALGSEHYLYDLVYNPSETKFLLQGKERGAAIENGHEMLLIQAEEAWKIWNS